MTEERRAEIKKILEADETAIYFQELKKAENATWGQGRAYHAWEDSLDNDTSIFEVRELPWGSNVEEEMRDFVDTLRAAGVDRFAVTDESTALMTSIHALVAAGGTLEGMFTLQGLRMKTEVMMEQMRRDAIDQTFEQFKAADRHYYETCEGGDEVTRLIHELEALGANMEVVVETDLHIRDAVFGM